MSLFPTLNLLLYLVQNPTHHLPKNLNLKKIDWNLLLKYTNLNRCLPFLEHFLDCPKCRKTVPQEFLSALKISYLAALSKSKVQEKEKEKIFNSFYPKNIIIVPLKDCSFWNLKYPSSVFIQKVDIDFFSPVNNYHAVDQIMRSQGYKPLKSPFPKDKFALLERDYMNLKNKNLLINFHFKDALPGTEGKVNPLDKKTINRFTDIFTKSINQKRNGIFLPSLETNIIFICLHFFFRDRFAGLRTLYDISQNLRQFKEKINWSQCLKITQDLEVESYFLFVLKIASLVFKTPLPAHISRRLLRVKRVSFALKFYFPLLSALAEGPEEWLNRKINRDLRFYRFFFFRLILWQKSLLRKIGPRTLILFLIYFIPTYLRFKINSPDFSKSPNY